MPVISDPIQYAPEDVFVDLRSTFGRRLYLKCEGFNFAGSIKMKAAAQMVTAAELDGSLLPGSTLVESSSGNLGLALSIIAASRGYGFVCVTDARCNPSVRAMMELYGTRVEVITSPSPVGGLLGARIDYVKRLCAEDDRYVWLNQYANPDNWRAHYRTTAPAIAKSFPQLDVLFVGAGTTGTLMGCARYFREHAPRVRVVAVDAEGSVTFGSPARPRLIPGLGTSVRPQILDDSYIDDVVHVSEAETVQACHRMAANGFLFGGSTGTVVSGALRWLDIHTTDEEVTALTIAPDLGERYLDSIYSGAWLREHFGTGDLLRA